MRNSMQKTLMGLTTLFIIIAGLIFDSNAKSINRIDQNNDINIINDIDDINIIGQTGIDGIIENIDEIGITQRIETAKNISIQQIENDINRSIVSDIDNNQIGIIGAIKRIKDIDDLRDIDVINSRIS